MSLNTKYIKFRFFDFWSVLHNTDLIILYLNIKTTIFFQINTMLHLSKYFLCTLVNEITIIWTGKEQKYIFEHKLPSFSIFDLWRSLSNTYFIVLYIIIRIAILCQINIILHLSTPDPCIGFKGMAISWIKKQKQSQI